MSVFLDSFKSLIADEFFKHHDDGLLSSRIVSLNICKKFMSAKVVLILDGGWSSWTTSSGAKCNNVGERGRRFASFVWQEYIVLISIQSGRYILPHILVSRILFFRKLFR